jgi:AcrR family transcriptional regulator
MASRTYKSKSRAPRTDIPAAPIAGRRARRHADTRERIFRAALKLFAEHGFQETTIEDITEAADVGKGTFFNYFPSKEHVLKAFGEIQRGKIETALLEARSAQTPFRALFRRLGDALLEEPGRSPAFFRSAMIAHLSSEPIRNHLCQNLALGRQKLAEFLALGQERGEVRRDIAPADLARGIQESFFGTMLFWCLHGGSDLKTWYEPMFRTLWSGIEARPAQNISSSKESSS